MERIRLDESRLGKDSLISLPRPERLLAMNGSIALAGD
jgi:hypothetical protein